MDNEGLNKKFVLMNELVVFTFTHYGYNQL